MSDGTEDRTPGHRSDEVDVVPLHTPRSWLTWILLLVGPVTWALHFLTVYVVAEAWCSTTAAPPTWLGLSAPVTVTLAVTAFALLQLAVGISFTARRYRRARIDAERAPVDAATIDDQFVRDRDLLLTGLLLGPLSAVAVLVVGVPAIWLSPC